MEGGFGFPLGGDPDELMRGLREFAERQTEAMQESQREQFSTLTLNAAVELTGAALGRLELSALVDEGGGLVRLARLRLGATQLIGGPAARHHHHTAGVLVQAVDDAGAWHRRQLRCMCQQAVHQRTACIACPGVYHQPCGFIDHQEVRVLMDDVEPHGFGLGTHSGIGNHGHDDGLTAQNPVAWPPLSAVDEHGAVQQPGFEAAA